MQNQLTLPDKSEFYNEISGPISDEDYKRAQTAYDDLKCENMYDYLLYYLKLDVLLLVDIFTNFRKICLLEDGLDPVHYLTLPHYSWDSALKRLPCKLTHLPSQLNIMSSFNVGFEEALHL